jgi:transcription elongation factor GreA
VKEVRAKLEVELHALERELTIELPREIKTAVAMGDLRENAEYHAALDRQRFVRARIGQLRGRLSELGTMNLDRIPKDSVGLGSTVVLTDLETDMS